jgi:hypothetical protein
MPDEEMHEAQPELEVEAARMMRLRMKMIWRSFATLLRVSQIQKYFQKAHQINQHLLSTKATLQDVYARML